MKQFIMVADDNEIICQILKNYLKEDYHITLFQNGVELLDAIHDGIIPDLIIADVKMPLLDGWGVLNNLKTSQFFKHIPVIMLSGIEKSQERIKFLKAGAEDYLIKPFSPEELKLKIELILKRTTHGSFEI